MRFDDMLTTVMAVAPADAVSRQIVWRQLVNILAQERRSVDPVLLNQAYDRLDALRKEVSPVVRASVAGSVAHRTSDARLVRYFALDDPAIAAEMLRHATLSIDNWRLLIREMPPTSRLLLRARRDLPAEVGAALAAYGAADFALNAPEVSSNASAAEHGATPIADVVARIEAFRARKVRDAEAHPEFAPVSTFELESDADGIVTYTSATPREPIIGLNMAVAGEQSHGGIDAYAAGAFRGRSAFRGARFHVGGKSDLAGDWRMDGDPMFDPSSGRFLGYRCIARRPLPHERAAPHDGQPTADSLRQMVHELRTPLNAIIGFAEMIERELLGPVNEAYRTRAEHIRADGARLVTAIDDIDLAARLESDRFERPSSAMIDLSALLTLVGRELSALTDLRLVHLRVVRPADALNVVADQPALHRLLSRLLSLLVGLASEGETLSVTMRREAGDVIVAVGRPRHLQGHNEQALLAENHDATADTNNGTSLLGLGFGLRLIASLAEAINVKFRIEDDVFALILVAAQDSAAMQQRGALQHDDERLPS